MGGGFGRCVVDPSILTVDDFRPPEGSDLGRVSVAGSPQEEGKDDDHHKTVVQPAR